MSDQYDRLQAILEKHAKELMDVMDSVQIIATVRSVNKAGDTTVLRDGRGCWYSRYGATRECVIHMEQIMRNCGPKPPPSTED